MKIQEFIQSIKDGKVHFNWNGHNIHYENESLIDGQPIRNHEINSFIKDLEDRIKRTFDKEQNPSQDPKDIELKMAEHYKKMANEIREEELEFPMEYFPPFHEVEYHCFNCGEPHLRYLAKSPTEIEVVRLTFPEPPPGKRWADAIMDSEPCIFRDGVKPIEVEIDVPSGKLVFVNFFKNYKEHDPKDEWSDEFSLNHARGRLNLSKHFAKQNIGYGQMGNMSVGIYQNKKNKGSIIIGKTDNPAECETLEKGEKGYDEWKAKCDEFNEKLGGFKVKGYVSCEVWRWMCCDASIIGEENWKPKDYSDEPVILTVPKGRYKIRHMYRSSTEHSEVVYSSIQKI